jgi:hypothetical protein
MFKHDSGNRPLNGVLYSPAKWEHDVKVAVAKQARREREEEQRKAQKEQ